MSIITTIAKHIELATLGLDQAKKAELLDLVNTGKNGVTRNGKTVAHVLSLINAEYPDSQNRRVRNFLIRYSHAANEVRKEAKALNAESVSLSRRVVKHTEKLAYHVEIAATDTRRLAVLRNPDLRGGVDEHPSTLESAAFEKSISQEFVNKKAVSTHQIISANYAELASAHQRLATLGQQHPWLKNEFSLKHAFKHIEKPSKESARLQEKTDRVLAGEYNDVSDKLNYLKEVAGYYNPQS